MSKGAGSVTVIVGTGGKTPLKSLPRTDPKKGYFRSWMGSNVDQTWGVAKFTITATSLTEQFVHVTGQQGSGNFSDSFTIKAGSSTFTPTPTSSMTATASPSLSPTITPSTTPGTTLAQDSFQRPNQIYWRTASDGQTWGTNANSFRAKPTQHLADICGKIGRFYGSWPFLILLAKSKTVLSSSLKTLQPVEKRFNG